MPLLVRQRSTPEVHRIYSGDPLMTVWWGTVVECASALARLRRESHISDADAAVAERNLEALAASWQELLAEPVLRDKACELLDSHALAAADALQLAAALLAAQGKPSELDFVCLDQRLATAAKAEGFRVITA